MSEKSKIRLTEIIELWEILHVKDTGELGYCDLEQAVDQVLSVQNDVTGYNPPASEKVEIPTGEKTSNFRQDLARAINCHSRENKSDTADFILVRFLDRCLSLFRYSIDLIDLVVKSSLPVKSSGRRAKKRILRKAK